VEKLERVLTAEDDARATLTDARTEAASIRAAGVEDARRIETEAAEASRRDAGVSRVIAVLDSVSAAARTDSLRVACGAFADSAGIAGVRGDSLRAACVRRDTAKVALLLKPDTMKRADSTLFRRPPSGLRDSRAIARDTTP